MGAGLSVPSQRENGETDTKLFRGRSAAPFWQAGPIDQPQLGKKGLRKIRARLCGGRRSALPVRWGRMRLALLPS